MLLKLHHARFLFTELQRPIGFDGAHDDELRDFDVRFRIILHKHITILGWWSILNIAGGLVALWLLEGTLYYFWMMSCIWGLINFAITIAVFNHTFYKKFHKESSYERFVAQNHIERVLFLNIGIDSAYVFVGFWLREHSFVHQVANPELWLGFGWAVVVQGVFLFFQDTIFFRLHRRNFRKAQPFLEQLLAGK
jgi:hypothetical protein